MVATAAEARPPTTSQMASRAWWVGCGLMFLAAAVLGVAAFIPAENTNPQVLEVFKGLLFACLGYVVGYPLGAAHPK